MADHVDSKREFFRHTLATLAYRAGKSLRDVPPGFATLTICEGTRTPGELLAHLCDLLNWTHSLLAGTEEWNISEPGEWDADVARFYAALERLDEYVASTDRGDLPLERLFQGPIADALTHVGQLAMIRRAAGAPVKGENYFAAAVEIGRVGEQQVGAEF